MPQKIFLASFMRCGMSGFSLSVCGELLGKRECSGGRVVSLSCGVEANL
jgi:hypothetical protein